MSAVKPTHPGDCVRERLYRPRDLAGLRILLAEDDTVMRELVAGALRRDGFEVIEAADGDVLAKLASAVAADELKVSLVITDVRMPGRSGLTALRILERSSDAPPVLVITAFGDPATHAAATRLGAAGVLDKPFEMDDLRTVVWHLARSGLRRERADSTGPGS